MARQYNVVDKNSRAYKEQQINGARSSLLLTLALTLVNVVLLMVNSNTFFLFSVFVPYELIHFGRMMDAGLVGSNTIVSLIVAAVILVVFLLSWLLSKKKPGWLTVAVVLFALDTAALLYFTFTMSADPGGNILDIGLHAYVLFQLIQGCVNAAKLKKEPEDSLDDQIASSPEIEF